MLNISMRKKQKRLIKKRLHSTTTIQKLNDKYKYTSHASWRLSSWNNIFSMCLQMYSLFMAFRTSCMFSLVNDVCVVQMEGLKEGKTISVVCTGLDMASVQNFIDSPKTHSQLIPKTLKTNGWLVRGSHGALTQNNHWLVLYPLLTSH